MIINRPYPLYPLCRDYESLTVDGIEVQDIPGFPNYAISREGRVWSKPRLRLGVGAFNRRIYKGKWLKLTINEWGYLYVQLYKNGKSKLKWVHRLVLETYVSLRPKNMECRHLDNNPGNNQIDNLAWGTKKENQADRKNNGTSMEGVKHPLTKFTEQQVRQIIYAYRTGLFTLMEIAEQYTVNWTTIRSIVNGKNWKHIWKEKNSGIISFSR